MSDGRCPAAEPHPRRPLQHRLRDVQLSTVDRHERGEGGGRVRQQRRAVAGLQQRRGTGQLRERGRRRSRHRMHEPVRHQLFCACEQRGRLVGKTGAGQHRLRLVEGARADQGRDGERRVAPHPRTEEPVDGGAAGEHPAVGEDGGGNRPGLGEIGRRHLLGGREHLVGLGEGEIEIA